MNAVWWVCSFIYSRAPWWRHTTVCKHTNTQTNALIKAQATNLVSVFTVHTVHSHTHNFTACQISFSRWPNSSDWLITFCLYICSCEFLETPSVSWSREVNGLTQMSQRFLCHICDWERPQPISYMTFACLEERSWACESSGSLLARFIVH